jgi:hypothetical protein
MHGIAQPVVHSSERERVSVSWRLYYSLSEMADMDSEIFEACFNDGKVAGKVKFFFTVFSNDLFVEV